jgi:integrase
MPPDNDRPPLPSPVESPATVGTGQRAGRSLERLAETARDYASARSSSNTQRAYTSDWALFSRWRRRKGFDETPDPQVVGLFLAAMASGDGVPKAAVSTIERRLAAITTTYRSAGTPLPRQDRHIVAMLATLPQNLRSYRDRAILLIGYAGALRHSEITGLDCGQEQTQANLEGSSGGWIKHLPEGLLLTIRGKTGWRQVEIGRGSRDATCPVQALERWLSLAKISHGPLFRRVREENSNVGPDRLNDVEVARFPSR